MGGGLLGQKSRKIVSSAIVCFGGVSHGAMLSWPAEVLPQLSGPWSNLGWLDKGTLTWIASVNFIGCMVGSLLYFPLQKVLSSNLILGISSFLASLAWLLVGLSTTPLTLCLSRICLGIGNSLLMATAPGYIYLVAPTSVRGCILNCYGIAIGLGLIYSVALGMQLPWKTLSFLAGIPGCILFLSSPLLSSTNPSHTVSSNPSSSSSSLLPRHIPSSSPPVVSNPLLLLCYLAAMYMLSGVVPLGSYVDFLFLDERTFCASDLVLASLVCQTVGGILGSGLIDRLGRKPVLQAGGWICLLSNIMLSLYFSTLDKDRQCPGLPGSVLCWTPAFATCLFFFGFGCGLGNIFFVLVGELIPPNRTATIIPLVTFFLNFVQFAVMKTYLLLDSVLDSTNMFFLQAGVNIFFLVGQAAWVPETLPQKESPRQGGYGTIGDIANMYNMANHRDMDTRHPVELANNTQFYVSLKRRRDSH